MSESRNALILHLASGGAPLVFALSEASAKSLRTRLPVLMASAGVDSPELADGANVAVNFGHVVSAHLDVAPSDAHVYGQAVRRTGFGG
ncbi:MAG: hypothetical protein M3443_12680 [Actinomycetota bacterium]|nr:hypothetical protein [Actinomycetota bacterium]